MVSSYLMQYSSPSISIEHSYVSVSACVYTCAVNLTVPAVPGSPVFEQKQTSLGFESSASAL